MNTMRTLLSPARLACSALALALAGVVGCHEHHDDHHADRGHDRDVLVVDNGHEHRGYYDEHHDWHGGYYDENHGYHEDPHDWHR